jgi:centromere protein C
VVKPITTVKSVARRLDFQTEKPKESMEPTKAFEVRNGRSPKGKAKARESPRPALAQEDERPDEDEGQGDEVVQESGTVSRDNERLPAAEGAEETNVEFVSGAYAGADDDDDYAPIVIDDDTPPPAVIAESEHEEEAQPASSPPSAKRKRGRPPKSPKARQQSEEIIPSPRMPPPRPVTQSSKAEKLSWSSLSGKRPPGTAAITNGFHYRAMPPPALPSKDKSKTQPPGKASQKSRIESEPKKRGRPRKDKLAKEVAELNAENSLMPPPAFIPKHRPPPRQPTEERDAEGESDYDDDDVYQPELRTKKSKHSHIHSNHSQTHALADKDPNTRLRSTSPGKSLWSQAASKRPVGRTLQILHENTPWEENPTVTRSGRRSVRPLEYWANEKVELDPHGTILNVVRAHSLEVEKNPRKQRVARSKRTQDGLDMGTLQEEEELEDWEEHGEVQQGAVALLDQETGEIDREDDKRTFILFPPHIEKFTHTNGT